MYRQWYSHWMVCWVPPSARLSRSYPTGLTEFSKWTFCRNTPQLRKTSTTWPPTQSIQSTCFNVNVKDQDQGEITNFSSDGEGNCVLLSALISSIVIIITSSSYCNISSDSSSSSSNNITTKCTVFFSNIPTCRISKRHYSYNKHTIILRTSNYS